MEKIQNSVAKQEEKKEFSLKSYVNSPKMQAQISKALPSVITPERFTRMLTTAISQNPMLNACTPMSFFGAMMSAAQLGLEPNTPLGQAYIIPYKNKGKLEAQFQIGYKGLIDLAYRSGQIDVIQAHTVYENDTFECEYGLEPKLKHIPASENRGNPVKYYAVFKTKDGGFGFEVMSKQDIENFAKKYSKAYTSDYSPWRTDFDEMAKKTVLKRTLKYAPLKSDFARELAQDGTIKSELDEDMTLIHDDLEVIEEEVENENGQTTETV